MLNKRHLGNQKGFTLIEIIAVLLLLGILAAVAVPKFFDMQEETEYQTLKVALNDMKSRAVLQHSKSILANDGASTVADQDEWDDLGFTNDADVNAAYQDFLGTWVRTSVLVVTYTTSYNGGDVTFTLTPGTVTDPATVALSAAP